ncbi:MAG TPA: SAM-dependent chlorinase/fluorinase [Planctomycetota bacterium]|nr:SAM-dependent chlorinase/fluorinase [Planctomycetota bacterium]
MVAPAGVVALLTDFGLKDHYVGVMKGAILSVNVHARIIDISHGVGSQDILEAYFLLSNTYRYFPQGTVFVAVVDPGVGSDRAIVAVEADRYTFLAPDNGLLGFLEKDDRIRRIVQVKDERYFLKPVSNTFHGRDIFAPVAGHLSQGIDLLQLGPEIPRIQKIVAPAPKVTQEGVIVGEIVSIDRFGNLVSNIPGERLAAADAVEVKVGKSVIRRLSTSYASAKKGELLAIVGSTGNLEISVARGDARKKTGAKVGDGVRVHHSKK